MQAELDSSNENWDIEDAYLFVSDRFWLLLMDRAEQQGCFTAPEEAHEADARYELALRVLVPAMALQGTRTPRVSSDALSRVQARIKKDTGAMQANADAFIHIATNTIAPWLEQRLGLKPQTQPKPSGAEATPEAAVTLTLRIALLGNSGVGKTSALQRFTKRDHFNNKPASTLSAAESEHLKGFQLDPSICGISNAAANVLLVDTAGQERFRDAISPQTLRNANALVVVTSHEETETDRTGWITFIKDRGFDDTVPIFTFYNKSDIQPNEYGKKTHGVLVAETPTQPASFFGSAKLPTAEGGVPEFFSYVINMTAKAHLAKEPTQKGKLTNGDTIRVGDASGGTKVAKTRKKRCLWCVGS